MRAYMEVGYQGIFSVENEDPILSGEVGVERALYVLKNVRNESAGNDVKPPVILSGVSASLAKHLRSRRTPMN